MAKEMNDDELRGRLTPEQYRVTQQKGTEPAFTGEYHDHKADGTYRCICCGETLFDSNTKFDSGTGWPSFFQPVGQEHVGMESDESHGMFRTEVTCGSCGAHLGHVFNDGPQPTAQRYCINSRALDFEARRHGQKDGQDDGPNDS